MIQLSAEEREQILKFSKEFVNIHQSILSVEENIAKLEIESSGLISQLERCREVENEFVEQLENKYGEGKLDPINLTWKKEILNEIHQ
jgi:hypothetical protein